MYPYHNRIKQRIANGELVRFYQEQNYGKIGECLILVFSTPPMLLPIRTHALWRYKQVLENYKEIKK